MSIDERALRAIVADGDRVVLGADIPERYLSDALGRRRGTADALVFPLSTEEVSGVLRYAHAHRIPVTPRGAGTNLVGSTVPVQGGILLDLSRMDRVLADGTVMTVGGKQVKDASGLSLKQLLIGSEGTLAVITKCLLRLLPKPETSVSVLVPYPDLDTGIRSVLTILRADADPTAVEFMERKVVALGERSSGVRYPRPDAGSYILLTFDGRRSTVEANVERVRTLALAHGALDYLVLTDPAQAADIWKARGALVKAVEAVSEQEPVDIVVPISRTAEFARSINELEASSGVQMIAFGHAGDGNVHLCVVRGDRDEETWQRALHETMDAAYAEAYRLGGVAVRAVLARGDRSEIGTIIGKKAKVFPFRDLD